MPPEPSLRTIRYCRISDGIWRLSMVAPHLRRPALARCLVSARVYQSGGRRPAGTWQRWTTAFKRLACSERQILPDVGNRAVDQVVFQLQGLGRGEAGRRGQRVLGGG